MSANVTFTNASAYLDEFVFISSAYDELPAFSRFTRVFQLSCETEQKWWHGDKDWRVTALGCFYSASEQLDDVALLSEEGHVEFYGEHQPRVEKIPGAGIWSEDAVNWGYEADIQQIGEHLYVCGYRGQVYKRRGPNDWVHMDEGLLQPPGTPQAENIALSAINGPHENAIYAVGYQHAEWLPARGFFWNGSAWRRLELPEVAERLTNLYIESETRIWMCGSNGTVLLGNAQDGFQSLSTVEDNQLFLSLCKYRDIIFLGSNLGLFAYDPADHGAGIRKVVTGLKPEIQDANIVDAVDQVLWSIGPKDIVRYDGEKWERIDHPDNPPIR